jgi:hypothetical protein
MIKNNLALVRALIDAFLFLESADSEEVNPDSAVRCMENIASSLLSMETSDQIALRSICAKIADESNDASYSSFVRSLPDMIGLAAGTE